MENRNPCSNTLLLFKTEFYLSLTNDINLGSCQFKGMNFFWSVTLCRCLRLPLFFFIFFFFQFSCLFLPCMLLIFPLLFQTLILPQVRCIMTHSLCIISCSHSYWVLQNTIYLMKILVLDVYLYLIVFQNLSFIVLCVQRRFLNGKKNDGKKEFVPFLCLNVFEIYVKSCWFTLMRKYIVS